MCSSHRRATARALPMPSIVANSHKATRMRGSAGGWPGCPSTALLEPRQVQPLDKPPDQANTVIGRHEILEADRPKLHLTTLRHPQPGGAPAAAPFRRHQFRQTFEQFRFATRGHRQTSKQDTTMTILAAEIRSDTRKFPKGVINTVYGRGGAVVPRPLNSGRINILTLIGSSRVADHLKKLHPKLNRLRAVLGLDAKNAAIVLPDADIELAVKECLLGSLSFNGQRCTALKMLIVHQSIVDQFLRRFSEEVGKLKVGMPWEKGVSITPLPVRDKVRFMTEAVEDAKTKGARVVNEGGGAAARTLFYPAVVYPVKEGMQLYREEQFGPIVPVMPFDDIETALEYIITSEHGQQVSIFSTNPDKIGALVDPLVNQVCRVNINCQCQRGPDVFPSTGRKDSAEGTLSVTDALRSFSIRSMIAAKQTDQSKQLLDTIVTQHKSKFINTRYVF